MKKQNRGITLVALVITIILLLILAGISISALTGSGLFRKAGEAKNDYEEAEKRENSILGEYENYIDNFGKNESNEEIIQFTVNGNPYSTVKGTTWREYIEKENCENLTMFINAGYPTYDYFIAVKGSAEYWDASIGYTADKLDIENVDEEIVEKNYSIKNVSVGWNVGEVDVK